MFRALIISLALAVSASARTYTTTFSATENPISAGSLWINGLATGLDWANVRTIPGLAFGTQSGVESSDNDSTALILGAWGPDQTATATVHSVNQQNGPTGNFEEVELRLRSAITAHSCTGYEILFNCRHDGNQYIQIVRWNGALDAFTLINGQTGPGISDGDIIKATIVGSTITAYVNGTSIFSVTDTTYTTGAPGVGFYFKVSSGTPANSDFGLSAFSVTDGLAVAPPSRTGRKLLP